MAKFLTALATGIPSPLCLGPNKSFQVCDQSDGIEHGINPAFLGWEEGLIGMCEGQVLAIINWPVLKSLFL